MALCIRGFAARGLEPVSTCSLRAPEAQNSPRLIPLIYKSHIPIPQNRLDQNIVTWHALCMLMCVGVITRFKLKAKSEE